MTSQAKKISENLEVGLERLKIVYEGLQNPLRELPPNEAAKLTAQALIYCAKMYMGAKPSEDDKSLYAEGAAFISSKYSYLGVAEIREAFAIAAKGNKFTVDMKAYWGTFSLSTVGEILTKYTEYRNKIAASIKNTIEKAEAAEREAAEREMKNQDTKEAVCKEIANLIAARNEGIPFYESWEDIPSFYTQIALENGLIKIEADYKRELWKKAKNLAYKEMKSQKQDEFLRGATSGDMFKEYIKQLEQANVKGFEGKARNIYSKLLLWECIKPI